MMTIVFLLFLFLNRIGLAKRHYIVHFEENGSRIKISLKKTHFKSRAYYLAYQVFETQKEVEWVTVDECVFGQVVRCWTYIRGRKSPLITFSAIGF